MTDDPTVKRNDVPAKNVVSPRSPNMPVIACDFAKVMIDMNAHSCTFAFFRQHPIVKYDEKGMRLDSIES